MGSSISSNKTANAEISAAGLIWTLYLSPAALRLSSIDKRMRNS
jgi:hypothetical protein